MAYRPDIHRRRSIRLLGHDYRMPGAYFITVCTHGREPLFGHVSGGAMHASDAGRLVQSMWDGIPAWFPHVVLDEFIIMPDHIHGILRAGFPGAASNAPTIGIIMRRFKSCSAIAVNRLLGRAAKPLWQRNYWERIIRDDAELQAARRYIRNNPERWRKRAG
jgi:REP element-mobilizing transposase RayT